MVGAIALLAFLAFIALVISKSLPAELILTPVGDDTLTAEMTAVVDELGRLGFARGATPYEIGVQPPAILLPLVDATGTMCATVVRTGTVPARVAWDLVSILDGFRGGLTSGANPDGASLPASSGSLRQVLPGASPTEVHAHHRLGMAHVAGHGLSWKRVSLHDFAYDFRAAMARERAAFLRRPWLYPPVALWRSVTEMSPHLGPLAYQAAAARALDDIRAGRMAAPEVRPIR